ncbi:putative mitochondrial protein, partial [Nicotiana attenuata]
PSSRIVTRSQNNVFKPKQVFDYLAVSPNKTLPLAPHTFKQANKYIEWHDAMHAEYSALLNNATWSLVPPTSSQNVIGCKWVLCVKYNADGSIERYKARLVAKGFHQRPGVDFI